MPLETINKGLKTIVHEYLNSDERYIEELGKIPATLSFQCLIYGEDSLNSRIQFEQALDAGGFGELIHPVYGSLQVKLIGTYTVSSSQRRIGEHIFDVTFGVSRENITPEIKFISNNEITNQVLRNFSVITDVFASVYQPIKHGFNIEFTGVNVLDFVNKMVALVEDIETGIVPENLNVFLKESQRIQSDIFNIVKSPDRIASEINLLYSNFRDIVSTPAVLFDSLQALIITKETFYPSDTYIRQNRRVANLLIEEYINLTSLNFLYESAVYRDFQTDIELLESQEVISDYYYTFFETQPDNNDPIPKIAETISARDDFAILQNLFAEAMMLKTQNVWKVKEIEDNGSTPLLAYKYFGNLEALDIINQLNPGINHSGFSGKFLMVSK
jgi:prophage DNA circulation protein